MSVFYKYLFLRDTDKNREIRYVLCVFEAFLQYKKICKENLLEFTEMDNIIWEGVLLEYGSKPNEMPNLQQATHLYRLFSDQKRKADTTIHTKIPTGKYA